MIVYRCAICHLYLVCPPLLSVLVLKRFQDDKDILKTSIFFLKTMLTIETWNEIVEVSTLLTFKSNQSRLELQERYNFWRQHLFILSEESRKKSVKIFHFSSLGVVRSLWFLTVILCKHDRRVPYFLSCIFCWSF